MVSLGHNGLTHWGLYKIADILQATFFVSPFLANVSLKFAPKSQIDNNSWLVPVMVQNQPDISHYIRPSPLTKMHH